MNPKVGHNRPSYIPAGPWNHHQNGGFSSPGTSQLGQVTSPDSAIGSPGVSPSSTSGGVSSPLSPYAAPFTSRRNSPHQSLAPMNGHDPDLGFYGYPAVNGSFSMTSFAQENSANSLPGAMNAVKLAKPPCLCNRPRGVIYCKRCGFEMQGRKMRMCEAHPNRQALMDIQTCPKCRAPLNSLKEIDPSETA